MFSLAAIDFHSSTWREIRTWAEEQIASARIELESESLDLRRSDYLRGRIAALKHLLTLAVPQPEIPSSSTPYAG